MALLLNIMCTSFNFIQFCCLHTLTSGTLILYWHRNIFSLKIDYTRKKNTSYQVFNPFKWNISYGDLIFIWKKNLVQPYKRLSKFSTINKFTMIQQRQDCILRDIINNWRNNGQETYDSAPSLSNS